MKLGHEWTSTSARNPWDVIICVCMVSVPTSPTPIALLTATAILSIQCLTETPQNTPTDMGLSTVSVRYRTLISSQHNTFDHCFVGHPFKRSNEMTIFYLRMPWYAMTKILWWNMFASFSTRLNKPSLCSNLYIPRKLDQYHGCGFFFFTYQCNYQWRYWLCMITIPCPPQLRMTSVCTIPVVRRNSTRKGLRPLWRHSDHYFIRSPLDPGCQIGWISGHVHAGSRGTSFRTRP